MDITKEVEAAMRKHKAEEPARLARKHWRYEFAKAAMQGKIAYDGNLDIGNCIRVADALLAELEKDN